MAVMATVVMAMAAMAMGVTVMAAIAMVVAAAAVVFTVVGDGHLGYIGDVGAENETTDIVLAMIGLPA